MATGDPLANRPEQVTAASPQAGAPTSGAETPNGIQADAGPAPVVLAPLPQRPPAQPPDPEVLRRRMRWLDGLLVLLLLTFAFLSASFPIAHSDFFLHAATGRLIAQGEFSFGSDPFTFGSEGRYWVNHSWLFDLLVYSVYRIPAYGGTLLVVVEGLLVALVAWIMLLVARPAGQRLWLPASCVALALLALSPRLLLTPTIFSYLFLALTLWLLVRPGGTASTRSWWLIPVVCLLWANMDSWFLLGPITVALFLLGELAQRFAKDRSGQEGTTGRLGQLALVLLVSVAACLATPYHVRGLILPPALGYSEAGSILRQEFRGLYLLPWEKGYFQRGLGLSAAGLAYFPLVLLGVLSFGLTFGTWRWWRVLVWLSFLVFSSCNFRAISFFAVVAGPITALNFADFAAGRFGTELRLEPGWRRWSLSGRLLTLLAAVLLVLGTIPGWLQAEPYHLRAVGWSVRPDPSLKQVALQIKRWREEGLIQPGQHWFNTRPEMVSYLAWYCPGEKGFLDMRLALYSKEVAEDYQRVRRALAGSENPEGKEHGEFAWRDVFTSREVRFLLFDSYDPARDLTSFLRLYGSPEEWVPCYLGGRVAVFGWRGTEKRGKGQPFVGMAVDFQQRAFGPNAERAPTQRAQPPQPRAWWREFWTVRRPDSAAAGTVLQHTIRFHAFNPRYRNRLRLEWQGMILASLVGTAAGPAGPLCNGTLLPWRINATYWHLLHRYPPRSPEEPPDKLDREFISWMGRYEMAQNAGPPDSLYLAIRAARRALVENPSESRTYLVLAESYKLLATRTRERNRTQGILPHVAEIRQTQLAYAFNQVLRLEPAPQIAQAAHLGLVELYAPPRYFELRIHHFKEYLRISRQVGSLLRVPPEKYKEVLTSLEAGLKQAKRELENKQDQFEVTAANKPVLQKAQIAMQHGLCETAIKLLLEADVEELHDKRNPRVRIGAAMLLQLLLAVGRLDEVREALNPDPTNADAFDKRSLGALSTGIPAYEWFQIQLAAGCGDYATADRYFGELLAQATSTRAVYYRLAQLDILSYRQAAARSGGALDMVALAVGDFLLREATQATRLPWQIRRHFPFPLQPPYGLRLPRSDLTWTQAARICIEIVQHEADLRTLRGWLALEAGDIATARRQLDLVMQRTTVSKGPGDQIRTVVTRSAGLAWLCRDLLAGRD
jgi:hypothetical protein